MAFEFDRSLEAGEFRCCLCQAAIHNSIQVIAVCGHVFHPACLARWFRSGMPYCPRCQVNIVDVEIATIERFVEGDQVIEDSTAAAG